MTLVVNTTRRRYLKIRRKLANNGCENMIETLHGTGYRLNITVDSPRFKKY